jgi:hypothetical protein
MISMHVPTFSPFVPHLRLLQNSVLSECQYRLPTLGLPLLGILGAAHSREALRGTLARPMSAMDLAEITQRSVAQYRPFAPTMIPVPFKMEPW